MTQYVCDRCGAKSTVPLASINVPQGRHFEKQKLVDLCPSCVIQLHTWTGKLPLAEESQNQTVMSKECKILIERLAEYYQSTERPHAPHSSHPRCCEICRLWYLLADVPEKHFTELSEFIKQ